MTMHCQKNSRIGLYIRFQQQKKQNISIALTTHLRIFATSHYTVVSTGKNIKIKMLQNQKPPQHQKCQQIWNPYAIFYSLLKSSSVVE
jgi:hypothetical protein